MGPLVDLGLNLRLLKLFGLLGLEGVSPRVSALHGAYTCLGVTAYLLTLLPAAAALLRDWGSLDDVVDDACLTLPVAFSTARCVYFVTRRRHMTRVIADLLRFEDYECPRTVAAERAAIMSKVSREAHATTVFFMVLGVFMLVTNSASPLMASTPASSRLLPVTGEYFFEHGRSPYFEILYGSQVATLGLLIFNVLVFDTASMAFVMHAGAQFKVLAVALRNIPRVAEDELVQAGHAVGLEEMADDDRSVKINNHIRQCLIRCIEHHKDITKLVKQLDTVYSPVMMGLIVYSMAVIAINSFKVTESSAEVADLLKFAGVASTGVFELYYFCRVCDDVTEQSQDVAAAVYSCDWEDADAETKRIVQMMVTRANRPARLTAGGFKVMSLETYAAILNSSYSFFAMLKQLNK